jgi:hypothetical protein
MNELDKIKISVVLPVCDKNAGKINPNQSLKHSNGSSLSKHTVDFVPCIESPCFSKPLLLFTVKIFERFLFFLTTKTLTRVKMS